MNAEQQRIAIAEELGWKQVVKVEVGDEGYPEEFLRWVNSKGEMLSLPNYPKDLNACAEFEATMDPNGNEYTRFDNHLHKICGSVRKCIHATAAQRCEAFLRTKGLWK